MKYYYHYQVNNEDFMDSIKICYIKLSQSKDYLHNVWIIATIQNKSQNSKNPDSAWAFLKRIYTVISQLKNKLRFQIKFYIIIVGIINVNKRIS